MATTNAATTVQGTTVAKKHERKVQITIATLSKLANEPVLLQHFINTVNDNPDMTAVMAMGIAEALTKMTINKN